MKNKINILHALKCSVTNGKIALLLIASITLLTSCENKLSRSDAEEKIIKKLNLPKIETKDLTIEDQGPTSSETQNRLKLLQDEGLAYYSVDYFNGTGTTGDLTEKGKEFAASDKFYSDYRRFIKVKVAKFEFGEITGIASNEYNANVNFTVKRTNINTIGKIAYNLKEETLNLTITFSKYDDGWRINDSKYDDSEYLNYLNRAFY